MQGVIGSAAENKNASLKPTAHELSEGLALGKVCQDAPSQRELGMRVSIRKLGE